MLADKKYLATYYTSVSAAVLLNELALDPARWPDVDFGADAEDFSFALGDFACGTGTLLASAMGALRSAWATERAHRGLPVDHAALSRHLIEDGVYG